MIVKTKSYRTLLRARFPRVDASVHILRGGLICLVTVRQKAACISYFPTSYYTFAARSQVHLFILCPRTQASTPLHCFKVVVYAHQSVMQKRSGIFFPLPAEQECNHLYFEIHFQLSGKTNDTEGKLSKVTVIIPPMKPTPSSNGGTVFFKLFYSC